MNKYLKKFVYFLIVFMILVIISLLLGTVTYLFIESPIKTKITINKIFNNVFNKKALSISIIIFAIITIFILYTLVKFQYLNPTKLINKEDRAKSGLHGQARFQTPEEMAKNFGIKNKKNEFKPFNWEELPESNFEGIICNSFKKNKKLYIEGCSEIHSLIIGGTGSGKTTGIISPTIQANALSKNKPSMLIYDLKGDLYKTHSKMLEEQGYNVLILNLKEPVKSIKYNPLSIIWELYQKLQEAIKNNDVVNQTDLETRISNYITDIALKIVPTASGENKIWSEGSQGIIKGLLWGMLEDSTNPEYKMTKEKFTLSQLGNILNIPSQKEELFNFLQDRYKDSIVFKKSGIILNNESEKTVASYISNTQTNLEKFTEVGIELVTAKSDFEMEDLIKNPTAIFVAIDDTNPACHILCSLLTSQVRNYLVYYADTHGGSLNRTWYFLLDEFANLPKIENFNKWMSTDRGRKLFYCIILQSLSQLKNIFNEEEKTEIINNCSLQIYLKSSELQSLKYFQDLFGTYTEYSRSANINEKSLGNSTFEGSKSLVQRHLVNLDDLQYISVGNIYFFYIGLPPCKATLIPFYDEEINSRGFFKKGCKNISILNERPLWNDCYYDLEYRREIYLKNSYKQENDYDDINYEETLNKETQKIIDVTEEYVVKETPSDNNPAITQMNYEDLSKVLNWTTQNNSIQTNEKVEQEENKIKSEPKLKSSVFPEHEQEEDEFLRTLKLLKSRRKRGTHDEDDE